MGRDSFGKVGRVVWGAESDGGPQAESEGLAPTACRTGPECAVAPHVTAQSVVRGAREARELWRRARVSARVVRVVRACERAFGSSLPVAGRRCLRRLPKLHQQRVD